MFWDALCSSAVAGAECAAIEGDAVRPFTWGGQAERARRVAAELRTEHGIRAGARVACVLTNSTGAVAGLAGVWFAGATVVSLPIIARGMRPESYAAQLVALARASSAELLLIEERFRPFVPATLSDELSVASFESLVDGEGTAEPSPPEPDETAFVQFSSGTTSEPRGVVLTAAAIERQLTSLADALSIDPARDRGAVWLPLSHDMGLFGCLLLAWFTGMPGLLTTPARFLGAPRTWLDDCGTFGATITAAPPSALPLAQRADRAGGGLSLDSLRACLVGGERISWRALEAGNAVFAARGAHAGVVTPAYGLAEATLAVSVGDSRERARVGWYEESALWRGEVVPSSSEADGAVGIVSCGRPLRGTSVAIESDAAIGEILVNSPSAASGYLEAPDATRRTFADGSIRTSDLGLIRDGELYPVARTDDVLNVGGRRVSALAAEESAAEHPAVRSGTGVIVESTADSSRYVLLAELQAASTPPESLRELAMELRRMSLDVGGPPIAECLFLPRGLLPKTPSGKAQRHRARQLVAEPPELAIRVTLR